ncbi:fluoride efflux transporter FluC [Catenuloplanes nepalensis]|nr:CrcB family protein [Catenuloplanes nepalensis]
MPGWPVVGVVAAGGALGAAARYAVAVAWPGPWTTVVINVAGCLAIGAVLARIADRPLLRPFVATGVLGGFTTFSTFAMQSLELGDPVYVGVTVAGSLGAAWLGQRIFRKPTGPPGYA